MKVKKIAFGDFEESFIENRLSDRVNIVYSNDNNKGKTLLIQGLMYSLGNVPIFPSGFDYQNYYFYSMIEIGGRDIEYIRKNKTTLVKESSGIRILESLSELKYFISKNVFTLPNINKNGEKKIVDPYLFYQLFFIGQDKRNTSNIQNVGQYNKNDFVNMLTALNGSQESTIDDFEIEESRKEIKQNKSEIQIINKKMTFLRENPDIAAYSIEVADQEEFKEFRERLSTIYNNITQYKNKRMREINRKTKLENLLSELNSLNQKIEIGKVKCAECGSDRVIYTNGDMSFEISNSVVRNSIITSIKEQITLKEEIVEELTENIQSEQDKQKKLLKDTPPQMQDVLVFSEEILTEAEYSSSVLRLQDEIAILENRLRMSAEDNNENKEQNKRMIDSIIKKMNTYYRSIDPDGNLLMDRIFTENDENFSGSEGQEFYFSQLLSFNEYFKHEFPIIIDSYRSGELSSDKEMKMLDFYKKADKQVILTATLKKEEYHKPKYREDKDLNIIDYSSHQNSKILSPNFKEDFLEILKSFNLTS